MCHVEHIFVCPKPFHMCTHHPHHNCKERKDVHDNNKRTRENHTRANATTCWASTAFTYLDLCSIIYAGFYFFITILSNSIFLLNVINADFRQRKSFDVYIFSNHAKYVNGNSSVINIINDNVYSFQNKPCLMWYVLCLNLLMCDMLVYPIRSMIRWYELQMSLGTEEGANSYIYITSTYATGYITFYFTNSCSVWQKFQVALWKLSVVALCHFEPFSLTSYAGSKNPWARIPRMTSMFTFDVHAHVWLGFKLLFSFKFFISLWHPESLARVSKISSCLVLILKNNVNYF